MEGGSGIGGSGETVVTVDVVALGVCLSGKELGMGNLKVVHDTVFAMDGREDFDFEVVVATPEIEAVVGSPVEVEGGEGDFEIGDGEEFPPL